MEYYLKTTESQDFLDVLAEGKALWNKYKTDEYSFDNSFYRDKRIHDGLVKHDAFYLEESSIENLKFNFTIVGLFEGEK